MEVAACALASYGGGVQVGQGLEEREERTSRSDEATHHCQSVWGTHGPRGPAKAGAWPGTATKPRDLGPSRISTKASPLTMRPTPERSGVKKNVLREPGGNPRPGTARVKCILYDRSRGRHTGVAPGRKRVKRWRGVHYTTARHRGDAGLAVTAAFSGNPQCPAESVHLASIP